MRIIFLVEKLMKKLSIKINAKSTTTRQKVMWFIGIYLLSISGMLLFHEFTKLLINFLK